MSEAGRPKGARAPLAWVVALGACTVWLVVQNAVLLAVVLWEDRLELARVAAVLVKASMLLAAHFWSTPAAVAGLAGLVTGVLLLRRPAAPRGRQVRHG
jgi:hypothetical protein